MLRHALARPLRLYTERVFLPLHQASTRFFFVVTRSDDGISDCHFLFPSPFISCCSHRPPRRGRDVVRLKNQVRQAIIVFHESPACMLTDRIDAPSGLAASFGRNKTLYPLFSPRLPSPRCSPWKTMMGSRSLTSRCPVPVYNSEAVS